MLSTLFLPPRKVTSPEGVQEMSHWPYFGACIKRIGVCVWHRWRAWALELGRQRMSPGVATFWLSGSLNPVSSSVRGLKHTYLPVRFKEGDASELLNQCWPFFSRRCKYSVMSRILNIPMCSLESLSTKWVLRGPGRGGYTKESLTSYHSVSSRKFRWKNFVI